MLFGPLLHSEWLRSARRRRHFVIRFFYGFSLLLVLCWMSILPAAGSPTWYMAQVAESFFYTLMWVQLLAVLLLTPAYVASAIAEEKDRKTLEFLLVTDLSSAEIVLSKLVVRLGHLVMILLTGLVVLSLTQFWGGVDPNLVLAGFVATGLTVLSLGGVSMLSSVYARKPWDAMVLTYGTVLAYLGLSALAHELLSLPIAKIALPLVSRWLTVGDLLTAVNAGNLFLALNHLYDAVAQNRPLADLLPSVLLEYGLFHALLAAGCISWAVFRLRPVALKQLVPQVRVPSRRFRLFRRPGVDDQPMLWKEIVVEGRLRFHWPGRLLLSVLVLASFLPLGFILDDWFHDALRGILRDPDPGEVSSVNEWVRIVGTGVACLLLLGVALRAANSISSERDRQTLDSLLSTPLETKEILRAKWRGSLLSVRWGWLWLGLIWLVGLATGGLHPIAVPFLLGTWLVYADVVACIGLWFSLVSRTTLRATVWTLFTIFGIWIGHSLLLMICCFPVFVFGLPAPLALGLLAFSAREDSFNEITVLLGLGMTLLAMLCWEGVARWIWGTTTTRFSQLYRRQPPRPLPLVPRWLQPAKPINAVLIAEEHLEEKPPTSLE